MLLSAGLIALVMSWRGRATDGHVYWELGLEDPSWQLALIAAGGLLELTYEGMSACHHSHPYGLLMLVAVLWLVLRWAARLRRWWSAELGLV